MQDGCCADYLITLVMERLSSSASSVQWDISTSTKTRQVSCVVLSHYPDDVDGASFKSSDEAVSPRKLY